MNYKMNYKIDDDLKYLICISSLIIIFTLFFCKNDIIETNEDHEDTTTTDTVCPDDFMCITINDLRIDIDKSKIGTSGILEDDEKARLINDYPGLSFSPSSNGRIIFFGNTRITLSKSGDTPTFNMRTMGSTFTRQSSSGSSLSSPGGTTFRSRETSRNSLHQSVIDEHNSSGPPDGFFTTTTEEPIVQEKTIVQENDSDMVYIVGGIVLLVLSIIAGVVFFMKKDDIKGLGKATRDAVQKGKSNIKTRNSARGRVEGGQKKTGPDTYFEGSDDF